MKTKVAKKRGAKKGTPRKGRLASRDALGPKPQAVTEELPLYCDYHCPKADFPPADAIGACRREQAVWCGLMKRYNSKNGKCLVRVE